MKAPNGAIRRFFFEKLIGVTLLHGSAQVGVADPIGVSGNPVHDRKLSAVPFKHHATHRHHIPKPRYQVTNWPEYDAALRQQGSLTVWFTDAAIAAWQAEPRTTPGGQPQYSALAITTALTLRAVFSLTLRQTEGLIGSIIDLLGLDLAAFHPEPAGSDVEDGA
jgi:Transposase DDE domain